jgi:hypothetical protein
MISLNFLTSFLVPLFLISSINLELKTYTPYSSLALEATWKTPFSIRPAILD